MEFRLSLASFIGADWRRIAKSRLLPTRPHGIRSIKRTVCMTGPRACCHGGAGLATRAAANPPTIMMDLYRWTIGLLYPRPLETIGTASVPLGLVLNDSRTRSLSYPPRAHEGFRRMSPKGSVEPAPDRAAALACRYAAVRGHSENLVRPLSAEDQCVQSMPDASPAKWHLAHTTWFIERMILRQSKAYTVFDTDYDALFNSYYLGLGTPFTRARRGLLTRPDVEEVMSYRRHVDAAMEPVFADPRSEE